MRRRIQPAGTFGCPAGTPKCFLVHYVHVSADLTHVYVCVCVCAYLCVCMCVCISMCVYIHIYIYIYIYIHIYISQYLIQIRVPLAALQVPQNVVCIFTCIHCAHTYTYIHPHTNLSHTPHTHIYTYTHACISTCWCTHRNEPYIHTYIYPCTHLPHMFTHTYTHT